MRGVSFGLLSATAGVLLSLLDPGALQAQLTFNGTMQNLVVDAQDHNLMWGSTYVAPYGLLYRSPDQGKTWQGIQYQTNPSNATPIYAVAVHPDKTGNTFVLTNSAGGFLWVTTDGGATWKNPGASWPANSFPTTVIVSRAPSQLVYVQLDKVLRKSVDGGISFDNGIPVPCDGRIEGSPADPRRLACVKTSDRSLYFSTDEGRTWTLGAKVTSGSVVSCDLVNDFHSANIYWGYCLTTQSGLEHDLFFRSTDGLRSINTAPSATGLPRVYYSPDRSIILTPGAGGLTRSRNLGMSWEKIGPPSSDLFGFDSADSNIVYRNGTARSTDGGSTFTPLNPLHAPLLAPIAPLEVTLEAGTAYEPRLSLKDLTGSTFSLYNLNKRTPADVHWAADLNDPNLPGYPRFYIDSTGLAPGKYETDVDLFSNGLPVGKLPVRLSVVPRKNPPLFFRSTRIAGSGDPSPEETGVAGPYLGDGGPAIASPLSISLGPLTSDPDGNVYMSTEYRVRRIDTKGIITTYAGSGARGNLGNGGPALKASFQFITDILWTPDGLLIADYFANVIRRVRSDGNVELFFAGTLTVGLDFNTHLALDSSNALYFSNTTGVYKWQGGSFALVFKHADVVPTVNGVTASNRSFTIDRSDNSFILGFSDRIVRRSQSGVVTILAGTPGLNGFWGDGNSSLEGSRIDSAELVAVDSHRSVYFAGAGRLRVILSGGVIGTVAGDGHFGNPLADNALATSGSTDDIYGVCVTAKDQIILVTRRRHVHRLDASEPPLPKVPQGAVVSLAAGAARVGQGAIFSIYGSELADTPMNNAGVPLPLILAGVSVEVNGKAVPLFFVSAVQINAQMPFDAPVGSARVRVVHGGFASAEVTVHVSAAGPDILQYGSKRAVAINLDGSINAPSAPAPAGSAVVLYLSGVGPVNPPVATGSPASGNPVSKATLAAHLTLNGREVTIEFLGLAPGFVGLAQANIRLPDDLKAGDYKLLLTIGGEKSNEVLLAVSARKK